MRFWLFPTTTFGDEDILQLDIAEADQQQQSLRAPPISVQPPSAFLQFPNDPLFAWSRWYLAFESYLLAIALEVLSDRRRNALLEHCLGTDRRSASVIATLDMQPSNDEQQRAEAKQYQRIVSELTAHFGTQANRNH